MAYRPVVSGSRVVLFGLLAGVALAGCATTGSEDDGTQAAADGFETDAGAAGYHVLLAEMALQKELYDVASDEYRQAALLSDDVAVASRATELAFELGRDEDALAAAQRWQELAGDDVAPHRYLARLYIRAGDPQAAARSLERLVREAGVPIEEAFLPISSLLMQESDVASALAAMQELVDDYRDVAQAQYSLGVLALRAGDLKMARAAAGQATVLDPEWAHASLLYARVMIADGEVDEGIAYAGERIGGLNSVSERLEYGILLAAVGRDIESRIVLEQVLQDENTSAGALRALGLLDLKEGDLDSAQAKFTALLATGRSTYDAFYYLGSIAESKQQLRRAIRIYSQVLEGPNAVAAQLRVGGLLADSGEIDEALQHLERFAAAQPRHTVDMALGQGEILSSDGQTDRALTLYDDVLAAYPGDSRVQFARAFLLEDLDRVDDALHQLRIILAANPNDPNALNALGYTLADRTEQIDEAYELILRAYELEPESPAIVDSLGWVQYKRGNLDEAQALLEEAYSRFPDAEIAAHLAEVLWRRGDADSAKQVLANALLRTPSSDQLLDVLKRIGSQ